MTHCFLGNWSENLTGWRLPKVAANQDLDAHSFPFASEKEIEKSGKGGGF